MSSQLKKINQSYQVRFGSMKKLRSYFLMLKHQPSKNMCNTCCILTILGHTEEREAHQKRVKNF